MVAKISTLTGTEAYPLLKGIGRSIVKFCNEVIPILNAGGHAFDANNIMQACHDWAQKIDMLILAPNLNSAALAYGEPALYDAVVEYTAIRDQLIVIRDAIYTRIPFSTNGKPEVFNIVNYRLEPIALPAAMRTAGVTALTNLLLLTE